MAAHVVVIDSSFRTTKVKVTPATYMTDVVGDACKKWNFDSSNYGLKNKTKPLDLSLTFRQTGLSSGARLELVLGSKSPSVVSVALQIPDPSGPGKRLTDKVPSDTTMWRILRKFESSEDTNLNFTARGVTEVVNGASGAGRIFYEMPTLQVVGRELSTFGDLQKTLAQIGVNGGSALIRLNFKKTDQPLEEAMAEIGQYFKDEENTGSEAAASEAQPTGKTDPDDIAKLASTEPSGEDTDMKDLSGDSREAVDSTPEGSAPEQPILGPGQRPISVYAAPSSDVPRAALQPHNEGDYEPTVAHAKLHQSRLLNSSQNRRLPSDKEAEQAEQEKAARLASVKTLEVKVRFPDQTQILASFNAEETAADFYKLVAGVILAEEEPFKLVWNDRGPQTVPKDESGSKRKLIKDLGLAGKVVVNFVWEESASESARKASTLKPEYLKEAKEVVIPEIAAVEAMDDAPSGVDKGKVKETADGEKKSKGAPKWLPKGLIRR
ncbi:UBX domain-containing 9 [Hyphodiscus hymeniophilus]|uniref:UBX domain-containing 9 n=1 Tax=Hyphodiscus hymeniophilus TaxID=353542 RepID=A0A9P7AZG8_9HELO|nr:UBX domain-containing 9 [Hyphodiscus hymeniophilus]